VKQNLKNKLTLFIVLMACVFPIAGQTLKIETIEITPFGFIGGDGEPTGMFYEISNRIAETAGIKYTNIIAPYKRTVDDLKSGNADFVLRFSNERLPAIAIPVVSVMPMQIVIIFKVGSAVNTLDELHGKTVGRVRGGKFDVNFNNDIAINKYKANDYLQIVKMLMYGRFDGGIGTNVGLYYSAKMLGIKPAELGPPLNLSSKDIVLHFSRKNADTKTLHALKVSVEKLKKNGEIKKIVNKYMGDFKWEISSK